MGQYHMYFENVVTFQKIVDTIERNFKIYFDNSANIDLKNVVSEIILKGMK